MPLSGPSLDRPIRVPDLLAGGLQQKPDDPALVSAERSWSWRELDRASSSYAANLLALGLKPGDRVASLMPNRDALPIHYLGCLKSGGSPFTNDVPSSEPTRPSTPCTRCDTYTGVLQSWTAVARNPPVGLGSSMIPSLSRPTSTTAGMEPLMAMSLGCGWYLSKWTPRISLRN